MGFFQMIREAIRRMLNRQTISDKARHDVAVSDKMTRAIELWDSMYTNTPPWRGGEAQVVPMQLPATICSEYSRLILTEFEMNVSGSKLADFINAQLKRELKNMDSIVERWAALGGIVIKPYVKGDDGHGRPTMLGLDVVPADRFYPLAFRDGQVTAACFLSEVQKGGRLYTRLEIHELDGTTYKVTNQAYKSEEERSGVFRDRFAYTCSLADVSDWEALAPEVTIEGVTQPLFVYLKTPLSNTVDTTSPLGVSVYSRATEAIKAADEQYGRVLWEYRAKEAAVFADETLFKTDKQGHPIIPAQDQRLFRTFAGDHEDSPILKDYSPEIRDESIFRGLNEHLMHIELLCGLAYGTLSHPQDVEKTATEIRSAKQRSYHTINRMQEALDEGLREVVEQMRTLILLYEMIPDGDIDVQMTFGDGVLEDTEQEYNRRWGMVLAGKLKLEAFYMWYFGCSEEEAKAMIPTDQGFPAEE